MKFKLQNLAIALMGLGFTLSIFEFLLDNSLAVLIAGTILLFISYFLRK